MTEMNAQKFIGMHCYIISVDDYRYHAQVTEVTEDKITFVDRQGLLYCLSLSDIKSILPDFKKLRELGKIPPKGEQ